MNSIFSVNSSIVAATLLVLVFLSIVTWSIALLKLWRGQQDNKRNRAFKAAFWAARAWREAIEVADCVRAGKLESDTMPLDESLAIMRTMDTIRSQWELKYPSEK